MKTLHVAVGVLMGSALLTSARHARAQAADTVAHNAPPPPPTTASKGGFVNAGTIPDDPTDLSPHCWLGCKGTLNRTMPGEWQNIQLRRDEAQAAARRAKRPHVMDTIPLPFRTRELASASPTRAAAAAGPDSSPASPGDAQRYLIEEWRHAELEVADSVHHAVLVRISHTFDSAQGTTMSPEDRSRVLRQVDDINQVNQMMWAGRRVDVNHHADSALRVLSATP
jgi:hypothetical protein